MRTVIALLAAVVLTQSASPTVSFQMQKLDDGQSETAALADINGDGRLDIVSSESWYEAPTWTGHAIRTINVTNNYLDNFGDLPLDVDGDGATDVIQIAYFARRIVWMKNPGKAGGPWTEHEIDAVGPTEFAFLVDLNNDGKANDLLPQFTGAAQHGLTWYELQNGNWIKRQVSSRNFGHGIGAGDINGDKRTDILTPQGWLEAPAGVRAAGEWTFHPTDWNQPTIPIGMPPGTAPAAPGTLAPIGARGGGQPPAVRVEYGFMHVLDINKDGRNDVLTTMGHSFGVLWIEQKADGSWQQHLIDNTWSRAHASTLADINGDGQLDLVTGARFMGRNAQETEPLALYWYEYRPSSAATTPGATTGPVSWTKHTISTGGDAGAGLQTVAADIDNDGDIDIVSGGKSGLFLGRNMRQ